MDAEQSPIISVRDLVKDFPVKGGIIFDRQIARIRAVDHVSFDLSEGEILGLVGESGCGKSTLGRCVLRLIEPSGGQVIFKGTNLLDLSRAQMRHQRQKLQLVFQDPYASLHPRMRIGSIIAEPLRLINLSKKDAMARVHRLLELVRLDSEHAERFPHELSGGQRQRVGVARALALDPEVLVLDEPVSALDVSVQSGLLNLLKDLQDRLGITCLFIAHDLSVVRHISDRVAVMYLGRIVEITRVEELYLTPRHPYTKALLSAVPVPDPIKERERDHIVLEGEVPSPLHPLKGCPFSSRCWRKRELCVNKTPQLEANDAGSAVACHYPLSESG